MSWLDYLQRQRLASELNQLQQAFRGAQQFAIASGRTVFVCLATTNNQCISDPSAGSKWLVHQDIANPSSPSEANILQSLPRNPQVRASGRWLVWGVGRDGLMRSWGSWLVCSGEQGAKVTINRGLRFSTSQTVCDE
ncbi:GspH/FimT family pseudopilin [uncultured Umboniibacter sp.]|uniref:pilus assembly FimT family protein n=1 Tax=uncultured Umboniibacter sp. TaxID=1798917 RepID=UPI0026323610|nr:GspH/FimT family pseudopilin [uncultured Umboniibacter sp.]